MADTGSLVSGIQNKIRILVARHSELQKDHRRLQAELQELKSVLEEQKKTITKTEEKIRNLTLTKTIENKEGAAEAKERINELVREIDKCIGLLNT
ncbi:MAG TPA: hypothetical protein VMC08_07955 [Bacteroidales bacterium]|nr:hypothetical protein [Bacteroidales bacterium]